MKMFDWEGDYCNSTKGHCWPRQNPYITTNTLTISNESKPKKVSVPEIKNVIFNPPATVVFWADGSKTVVKCHEEDYFSEECGLAMAICKKVYGNDNAFHKIFKKYVKEPEEVDTYTFNNYLGRFKEAFCLHGGCFDT